MAIDSRADVLVSRSMCYLGFTNPVTYDENHHDTKGYWLCMRCRDSFSGHINGDASRLHDGRCKLEAFREKSGVGNDLIYVLGPNEDGTSTPFRNVDTVFQQQDFLEQVKYKLASRLISISAAYAIRNAQVSSKFSST